MHILQSGRPKSGNYWLYKILQNVFNIAQIEKKSFIKSHSIYNKAQNWTLSHKDQSDVDTLSIGEKKCFVQISSAFREEITDIPYYINQTTHVWTHSPFTDMCHYVLPHFDNIIYIVRDPRDVAISLSQFAFTKYYQKYHPHNSKTPEQFLNQNFDALMSNWVSHVGNWILHKERYKMHIVFYEQMLLNFDIELDKLLGYLALRFDDNEKSVIKKNIQFSKMKNENPNHVREGKANKWIDILSDKHKMKADRIAFLMLRFLNYPLCSEIQQTNQSDKIPRLPTLIDKAALEKAIAAGKRTFVEKLRFYFYHPHILISKLKSGIRKSSRQTHLN